MGRAIRLVQKRNTAFDKISEIMTRALTVSVIHYSCESFYDRPDGTSPRITSIAIRNLENGQTISFSIHQMAEREGVSIENIAENYDQLENVMLNEFYEYVQSHITHLWLHWNMRDINYGFHAIAHRCQVLGGSPIDIPEANRVDLARLITAIYGVGYIGHPRLQKLVEKNKISNKDFLAGADEAEAFENREFVKLHLSTLRKVDILANIIERVDNRSLKTNSTWKDMYGNNFVAIGEQIKENWLVQIILFIFAIIGFIVSILQIIDWLK